MRFGLVFLITLALGGPAVAGDVKVLTLPPVEDLSMPFWCDWGYAWDERCYWDDSDRVGVGGVGDKVWRAGIKFSLDGLPPKTGVVAAELSLWYDGTCVAPRREIRPCDGAGFELDAHPILTPSWRAEREVEFGPLVASTALAPNTGPGRLTWTVTRLVADWHSGRLANYGVLLKLADGDESLESSGPAFPSSSYADPALRPQLKILYRNHACDGVESGCLPSRPLGLRAAATTLPFPVHPGRVD